MWRWLVLFVLLILVLLGIALFAPRTVSLTSGGVLAKANQATEAPSGDSFVTISVGGSNVFSLWKDFFDFPVFLYSFPDTRRFLLVYDDDTSVLAFVVDRGAPDTNAPDARLWPPDAYTRQVLERRATNVVVTSKGGVRLPTYAEVQEVSSIVTAWTPSQFRAASFPVLNLGFCQFHTSDKRFVLRALDPHRQSVWPTE